MSDYSKVHIHKDSPTELFCNTAVLYPVAAVDRDGFIKVPAYLRCKKCEKRAEKEKAKA